MLLGDRPMHNRLIGRLKPGSYFQEGIIQLHHLTSDPPSLPALKCDAYFKRGESNVSAGVRSVSKDRPWMNDDVTHPLRYANLQTGAISFGIIKSWRLSTFKHLNRSLPFLTSFLKFPYMQAPKWRFAPYSMSSYVMPVGMRQCASLVPSVYVPGPSFRRGAVHSLFFHSTTPSERVHILQASYTKIHLRL